ncbi:cyanophycin synthetase [Alkaliphilus serpentinus]|uniref:Cyanophycin synthetase n=1 Tax=Alkaliphilus serpentinus TaxID=1482731 RepID=A0A833HP19_9FIRM|nr:cyanophycin synthetase [Alkaliphilus serpentinus]KAB3530230.1 cyanophycin synthetase [Alkaliphilus serpentinus]
MKLINIRVYQGRNIYSHSPVIRMDVDVDKYLDIPSCDIRNFNETLLRQFPGLKEHKCSRGYKGGFVERLKRGTYIPHILEHVAIEIQSILGFKVHFGKTRYLEKETIYTIVFTYYDEVAGYEAGKLAFDILEGYLEGKSINVDERLQEIQKKIREKQLGPSTMAIVSEANKRGIPTIRLADNSLVHLGYGKYSRRIQATISSLTNCISVDAACDKELTKGLLEIFNIPVPRGRAVTTLTDAIKVAEELSYPVVVKPNNGNQGKGVSTNLKSSEEVEKAYHLASLYGDQIMVEDYIKGKHYRGIVVDGKLVAVAERIVAHVVGNGLNTIKELIDIENQNPLRGEDHEKPLTKIKMDEAMALFLEKYQIDLHSIPRENEVVYLRETANLSTGGIAIDVTDEIHPENVKLFTKAVEIIGLDIAGVDVVAQDISMNIRETGGGIIELNACPGIRMHHYPSRGKDRNVAGAILDMLFPANCPTSIPIFSITGTNGKTTTTRMLANILRKTGVTVGMTTTGGVYINDEEVMKGDTTGPQSAKAVLLDKRVEAAVLETARGGIVNRGLGYDLADVGIITNIGDDHLGIDGINNLEEMAKVKALVVEAIKDEGYAVLNADDEYTPLILEGVRCKVIYFSQNLNNPLLKQHMENRGKAVYLLDNKVYFYDGNKSHYVMPVNKIPSTYGGILKYNIENSLAAMAAAYSYGIDRKVIKEAMEAFYSNDVDNPGRFNVFQLKDFKVIVDYGHNIDGYTKVLEGLKEIKTGRLIGVIGVPGDRTDINILKVGEISGKYFDYIYIKEDKDLRGRKEEEVAKILKKGCCLGGVPEDKILIECCEVEALRRAIEGAQPNDTIIVFYEEYKPLLDLIKHYEAVLDHTGEKVTIEPQLAIKA